MWTRFRAHYVLDTAKMVENGDFDHAALTRMDYEKAKRQLQTLCGVGNKVADCILLFSLNKLEAFPVDVRIKHIILEYYSNNFSPDFVEKMSRKNSLSDKDYLQINEFGRKYFGIYAGYAQEYLYHWKHTIPNQRLLSLKAALDVHC